MKFSLFIILYKITLHLVPVNNDSCIQITSFLCTITRTHAPAHRNSLQCPGEESAQITTVWMVIKCLKWSRIFCYICLDGLVLFLSSLLSY